ncbi:MAG: acyloxyacyl hydrolase [Hyphomonadaceae bacterium]
MWGKAAGLALVGAAVMTPARAEALVDQAYVGVMAHNICVTDCKNANKEDGSSIELQLSFDSPSFLSWAGSPTPYVVASVNTAGDTSFGGFGLDWRWEFADGWALEPGVGYVVHDGELENPYATDDPRAPVFSDDHVLLGSRDLFRTSLGVTRRIGDGPWEAQLFFSHLSHGQILGTGRNQGMDQLGVRLGYQFGR